MVIPLLVALLFGLFEVRRIGVVVRPATYSRIIAELVLLALTSALWIVSSLTAEWDAVGSAPWWHDFLVGCAMIQGIALLATLVLLVLSVRESFEYVRRADRA
jgi:hypothetical protein